MASNEKIAVAAHLHVLLRRKTGRVTDTEWMASNAAYAFEIVRFAREKAAEDGHADLNLWAGRLEQIMRSPELKPRLPLATLMVEAVRERSVVAPVSRVPQAAHSVDTEDELFPESGFIESTFGGMFRDSDTSRRQDDTSAPRYVKGLR